MTTSRRTTLRTRWRVATASAAVAIAAALAGAAPAQAADTWTWSTATHPAGAASIGPLGWGTAGGGVYLWRGVYYIPGVGHIDQPLGTWREEKETGTGVLGRVAYTTYDGKPALPDIGLISTGTTPVPPTVRVSAAWPNAMVIDVAHPGDITQGLALCHSGTSPQTMAAGGHRCGTMGFDCSPPSTQCQLSVPASGGDSGGPVWDYAPGGIKLYGWITGAGFGYTSFVPTWAVQNHVWTESQSWRSWGYPPGNDGTGCFVTAAGCVRS